MRPLHHPAPENITVEGILHALSDPVRVHIFARIAQGDGPQTCSAFLEVGDRPIPKSTLSQHFNVLREAGLIHSERKGVEMHSSPRSADLDERFRPLIDAILVAHAAQERRQKAGRPKRARKPV